MNRNMLAFIVLGIALLLPISGANAEDPPASVDHRKYETEASDVMRYIQQHLYNPDDGLYYEKASNRHADFMWGNGITFSALVAASRYDSGTYLPIMTRFFKSMDRYWDFKAAIPGYEPAPSTGNGHDKYYDDNEWMVLAFTEAYAQTRDVQYLNRSEETLKFALSGWDDSLGGGIWWHEGHKGGGKNTCANAPAAVGCLRMARFLPRAEAKSSVAMAEKIVNWTVDHLEDRDNLFMDNQNVATEKISRGKLTYNTALMIRAFLDLYRWTGDAKYLTDAKASAKAGDWFLDHKTGAYRDSIKWSHLMVEADLEMYRATHEDYLLTRARANADHAYAAWKASPPDETIDNSSVARLLWLMADTESDTGRKFWADLDRVPK